MKMKSLAMLAASSLVAASFAYIAPALADDMSNSSGQSMPSQDNSMQNQGSSPTGAPSDNIGNPSSTDNSMNNGGSSNSSGSTDEGSSPDTATGDDDY